MENIFENEIGAILKSDTPIHYKVTQIKIRVAQGILSNREAQKLLQPYIDEFNANSIAIAKKYNQKAKLINYSSIRGV